MMAIQGATLNGIRVTSAKVNIPAWGCWYADVNLDGDHTVSGAATLVIADLTLVGTVISGGPQLGRSVYRVVAGKGGWGRTVARKAYANDAGVKLSTVLLDVASASGESLGAVGADRVGLYYARQEAPASRVLQDLVPQAWYVDNAGVTQIGSRPAGALVGTVTRVQPLDKARGKLVLAAEKIATILPGLVVDGITAVDVLHEISAEGGLRSTVWGSQVSSTLDSFRALMHQLDPNREFRGVTEYRIVTMSGNRLNLQPIRVGTGMPELERVPVRPGVAGCSASHTLGARVLVGFVDSDPASPYVASFEDEDGEGFQPATISIEALTSVAIAGGILPAARMGDMAGPFPIVATAVKVLI